MKESGGENKCAISKFECMIRINVTIEVKSEVRAQVIFRRLFPLRILSKSFRIGSIRKALILSRKRALQILIKFKK